MKKAIADGAAIREYIQESAAEYAVDKHIQYQRRVTSAAWDSSTATWTLSISGTDNGQEAESETLTCSFIYSCTGYFRYDKGYTPDFPWRRAV